MKNQFDQQFELFDKFSKANGIDNAYEVKMNFLAVDNAYKKAIERGGEYQLL